MQYFRAFQFFWIFLSLFLYFFLFMNPRVAITILQLWKNHKMTSRRRKALLYLRSLRDRICNIIAYTMMPAALKSPAWFSTSGTLARAHERRTRFSVLQTFLGKCKKWGHIHFRLLTHALMPVNSWRRKSFYFHPLHNSNAILASRRSLSANARVAVATGRPHHSAPCLNAAQRESQTRPPFRSTRPELASDVGGVRMRK